MSVVTYPAYLNHIASNDPLPRSPDRRAERDNRLMRSSFLVLVLPIALLADSVAGLKWTPPTGWNSSGTTSMRAATYPIAPAPGDRAAAECAVYFFGPGQGGGVQANLDRWEGQFKTAGGKPAPAKVTKITIHGLPVTTVDVSGEYSGMAGPTATAPVIVSGYRLLGAIIEGPGGNLFIKFTGPAKTVAANSAKYQQLLSSFEKTGK